VVLNIPQTHSTLIQDGIDSGMFYNITTDELDIDILAKLMFAQMRTLPERFYHIWAGFEDATFLGYYNTGINGKCDSGAPPLRISKCHTFNENAISVAWQSGGNKTCPYNTTKSAWNAGGSPGASTSSYTIPAYSWPNTSKAQTSMYPIPAWCRELFTADAHTGKRLVSFDGAPYDCRKRGWYYNVKNEMKKQYSGVYVDKKVQEPAVAACVPLNVSGPSHEPSVSYQGSLSDENGLVGVSCTGILLRDLSAYVKEIFSEFEYDVSAAYIVDRTTVQLRAVNNGSSTDRQRKYAAYFDYSKMAFVNPGKSDDPKIKWSWDVLKNPLNGSIGTPLTYDPTDPDEDFPYNVTMHRFDGADGDGYLYYVAKSSMVFEGLSDMGLEWDLVQVQRVECPAGSISEQAVCERCPAGKSADQILQVCVDCPAGTKSNEGSADCEDCGPGTFSKNSSITCSKCDSVAHLTSKKGAAACDQCVAGYYTTTRQNLDDPEDTKCHPCPVGVATCAGGSTLPK